MMSENDDGILSFEGRCEAALSVLRPLQAQIVEGLAEGRDDLEVHRRHDEELIAQHKPEFQEIFRRWASVGWSENAVLIAENQEISWEKAVQGIAIRYGEDAVMYALQVLNNEAKKGSI